MSVRKGSGFDSSFREHGNRDQFHAAFLSKPQHGRREQRCARGRPLRALPSSRNSLYTAAKGRNPTACGVLIPSTPSLGLLPSPPLPGGRDPRRSSTTALSQLTPARLTMPFPCGSPATIPSAGLRHHPLHFPASLM